MNERDDVTSSFERQQVLAEQLDAHYRQIPAMVLAPSLGGLFAAAVLWNAVDRRVLVTGMGAVLLLSALRLAAYRRYLRRRPDAPLAHWRALAVGASFVSGCLWGSAAPLLYPQGAPGHEVFLLVLLTMLPIVPVAALAAYLPAFWAYFLPCGLPFMATLLLDGRRAAPLAALLLAMMLGAMAAFATRYARTLAEAVLLRLRLAERTRLLEQAIEHKSRFIAAASHDLRQPVHAMGLFVEVLGRAGATGPAREAMRHIESSLATLRTMLDDILDLSRLDAQAFAARPRDLDAAALLQRLAGDHAPLAARQGLRFVCRSGALVLHSDPALLERMLRNLLANALKFTRAGGVALVCRRAGAAALVQVIDTGVGIAPHDQRRVFEEFTQVDTPGRADAKGLGLGLAIVQRLARLLGHELRLRSLPGRGSAFTIVVPLGRGPVAADPAPAPPARVPSGKRVLVIDDDEAVAAGATALLRLWGHRVKVFAGVAQALAALDSLDSLEAPEAPPDLLVIDGRLARGETGLDGIARLRQRLGRALPAIIVTGDTAPERIRESHAAGHALLHKPVHPARLEAAVAEALAAR
jgi:signal transduction histidine kinase/ActR/RegA family two-component response regulator